MSLDLASRVLAAIEETERIAIDAAARVRAWAPDQPPWEASRYLGKFASSLERFWAHNDPAAVLRRCAADRRMVNRHKPVVNHGRFSGEDALPGECDEYCPRDDNGDHEMVCGACRDLTGEPLPTPCADLRDVAEGHGITTEAMA